MAPNMNVQVESRIGALDDRQNDLVSIPAWAEPDLRPEACPRQIFSPLAVQFLRIRRLLATSCRKCRATLTK